MPSYLADYVRDLKNKERARSQIIDAQRRQIADLEMRVAFLRRKWDEETRAHTTTYSEYMDLREKAEELAKILERLAK